MALTSIIVSLDQDEYSKYESDRRVVTATITATASAAAVEVIRVDLIKARRTRDVVLATKDVSITFGAAGTLTGTAVFDLESILETGTDGRITNAFNVARHGMYFVKGTDAANALVSGASVDFPISLITIDRFMKDYLFGLEMSAFDIRVAKYQPQLITGVEIKELSKQHDLGFFPLTFNSAGSPVPSRTLSWMGGPLIPVPAPGTYVLPSRKKDNYAVVRVSSTALLPASPQVEEIIVDKATLSPESIRGFLDSALDWLEKTELQVFLEPTRVVSDSSGMLGGEFSSDYDAVGSATTLYPRTPGQWIDIQFPFPSILQVRTLIGSINKNKILAVDPQWIEISEKSGMVQLVPFSQQFAFQFVGLVWVEALRGPVPIPNFWHYDIYTGLREMPNDLREAMAKKAAIELLIIAGRAFRSVLSGQNVGRDGVYESVSFFNTGQGLYGSTIQQYQQFLDATLPKYRNRYRGPNLWVA